VLGWQMSLLMVSETKYGSLVRCDPSETRYKTYEDLNRSCSSRESRNWILSESRLFSTESTMQGKKV
jgi:hypothetical protein